MTTTTSSRTSPQRTRGWEVVRWIEAHCVHAEGDWYGKPFRLRREQKRFILRLYAVDDDGHPLYRQALLGLPRGNGKTELAAAIGAYELAGGSRISPVVIVAAASWEQADLVFGALKVMFRESPTLAQAAEVYESEILLRHEPGRAYRVAAVAGTNEGQRPTCVIGDELHEWLGSRERVWTVLTSGAAKRADSMVLAITTAGWDRGSLCYRLYERGKAIERGEEEARGYLFEWHEADAGAAIDDEATWAACNFALGDFLPPENLAAQLRTIPQHEFERYHLNRWADSPTEWITRDAWSGLGTEAEPPPDGAEVVLALAGSYDRGEVALVGCAIDPLRVFEVRTWERPEGQDDYRVQAGGVMAEIERAMERWKVREFAPNPLGWRVEIEELERRYGTVVVVFEIRKPMRWGPALDEFEQAARDGVLVHDGSPAIARGISRCTPIVRSGFTVLAAPVPAAAAAAVIAYHRARWYAANGDSVYESRGLITV